MQWRSAGVSIHRGGGGAANSLALIAAPIVFASPPGIAKECSAIFQDMGPWLMVASLRCIWRFGTGDLCKAIAGGCPVTRRARLRRKAGHFGMLLPGGVGCCILAARLRDVVRCARVEVWIASR